MGAKERVWLFVGLFLVLIGIALSAREGGQQVNPYAQTHTQGTQVPPAQEPLRADETRKEARKRVDPMRGVIDESKGVEYFR